MVDGIDWEVLDTDIRERALVDDLRAALTRTQEERTAPAVPAVRCAGCGVSLSVRTVETGDACGACGYLPDPPCSSCGGTGWTVHDCGDSTCGQEKDACEKCMAVPKSSILAHDWDPEVKGLNLRCRRCGYDMAATPTGDPRHRLSCPGPVEVCVLCLRTREDHGNPPHDFMSSIIPEPAPSPRQEPGACECGHAHVGPCAVRGCMCPHQPAPRQEPGGQHSHGCWSHEGKPCNCLPAPRQEQEACPSCHGYASWVERKTGAPCHVCQTSGGRDGK